MIGEEFLAEEFEAHRGHLKSVAYRMLGSLSDADDALQDAWLRVSRADTEDVQNMRAWLTTVVARVCLNMLRSRKTRREESLDTRVPDPVLDPGDESDPEHRVMLADSVGIAMMVVLETLKPSERLAFVLHDMFALPFEEIAPIAGRTPIATRQLASRARHRVQGAPVPDADVSSQRRVVDAFLAAAREGNFDALVRALDPDIVLRADYGAAPAFGSPVVRGAVAVANQALTFSRLQGPGYMSIPVLVNGAAGRANFMNGVLSSIMAFTVTNERIVAIDILADPERLAGIDVPAVDSSN